MCLTEKRKEIMVQKVDWKKKTSHRKEARDEKLTVIRYFNKQVTSNFHFAVFIGANTKHDIKTTEFASTRFGTPYYFHLQNIRHVCNFPARSMHGVTVLMNKILKKKSHLYFLQNYVKAHLDIRCTPSGVQQVIQTLKYNTDIKIKSSGQ
jgi:uncharacterized protein YycO